MSHIQSLGIILNSTQPPISIEILPGDVSLWQLEATVTTTCSAGPEQEQVATQQKYLFVENQLGVPKKLLYSTYVEAIAVFSKTKAGLGGLGSKENLEEDALLNATAVILLANPAHQTALNARKRLVLNGLRDIESELKFTATLLTLRDCSKQSILWHHRRWLLRMLHKPTHHLPTGIDRMDEDDLRGYDIPINTLIAELDIVTQACETYPRNYFAWNHRFRCMDALVFKFILRNIHASHLDTGRSISFSASVNVEHLVGFKAMIGEFGDAKSWIERHVSDYTAMQYFLRLVDRIRSLKELPEEDFGSELEALVLTETLRKEALDLVKAYPDHEALWVYLRGAIHATTGPSLREMDDDTVLELLSVAFGYLSSERLKSTAPESESETTEVEARRRKEHINAYRFIVWISREHGELVIARGWEPRLLLSAGYDRSSMRKWTLQR